MSLFVISANPEEKSLQWNDVSKALDVKEKKLEEANMFYDKAEWVITFNILLYYILIILYFFSEELVKLQTILQQMNDDNVLVKEKVEEISLTCSSMMKDLEDAKSKVS